ncbi:MAG: iron-containing alcohol dehydrogenase [Candidatus Heimdallarchaeota archaeon]|nr:iron-containing alcohol dehydrogenase [Candidatus Heimdallarchaeota archaeon]
MWFYCAPRKIVFGEDSLDELKEIKGKSALIVTDKVLLDLGIPQKAISLLEENEFKITIFDQVDYEPSIPMAKAGAEIARREEVDWIVAIGGGSVIDCAKSIWVFYENPDMSIDSVFPEDPLPLRDKARLITIPTTSGTGSDANWAIVISDPETKQKLSVGHRDLIPDIDIVDPSLTLKLPPHLTASTGMDVLAHAIEAYTIDWKNDFADAMAIQAIKLVFEFLPKAVKEGENIEYREKMHNAATMAGIAIGNSQIGGAHALAHSAGAVLNLPHGEIIALALPHMMRYCLEEDKTVQHYSEIAHTIGIKFETPKEGAEKLIERIEALILDLGLKTTLKEFGITHNQLQENMELLRDFALNDTGSLINPRELTNESIENLYYDMAGFVRGGYRNAVLKVDLSSQIHSVEPLDLEAAKNFVGGSGLGAYYYFKFLNTKNVSALSPENILIFMTGPLTGLPTSCAGRFTVCSRSPLTGFWGEANSGGNFGPELKFAGYDSIVLEGASDKPVYLLIDDDKVEIRDASHLWGLGTFATHEKILDELGDKKFKIACIGQAGENLVKYASIMNDEGRAAGRTGLGAVMGSKKLKAIVVKGSNKEFLLPKEFKEKSREAYDSIKEDFMVELTKELGTAGYLDVAIDMYGDLPIRNWSESKFEEAANLSGVTMKETILVGRYACYRCPIGCGRVIEIPEGKYKLPRTKGPEYETLGAFGTNLKIGDLEALSFANYKANDYGMDTISSGTTIGVLLDLVSKNFIPPEALPEGIDLSFGNVDTLLTLLDMITKREGIGNLLAEGSKVLAENYLYTALAPQIAGLEAPFHDPRAFSGWAIQYLTSPRGACHNNGDAYMIQQGTTFPELEIDDLPDSRFENSGIAKQMARLQSYRQLYNAMSICVFYNPPAPLVSDLLGMAVNQSYTPEDLILLGDRIYALKRIINLRLGWKPELQVLPNVMRQRLDGPTEGNTPDVETQLREWYEYRNYSQESGCPKGEELERLDLKEILSFCNFGD